MFEINSIIKSLPINKITEVYLVGSNNDYYKIFLVDKSNDAVRIDLKKGFEGNFNTITKSTIFNGNATQIVTPQIAKDLLSKCKYLNNVLKPNNDTFTATIKLLEIIDFKDIKQSKDNQTFMSWLRQQTGRDDLIGDITNDILQDPKLSGFESYDQIKEHIQNETFLNSWDINTFRDYKKKGNVNPLLCLKLAKLEYDVYIKKNKLKKFAIRNNSGFVYFLKYETQNSPIKIGRAKNIQTRITQLQTSLPYDLETIGYIETDNYFDLERKIHLEFEDRKLKREWFELTISEVTEIITKYSGVLLQGYEHCP
ncbi:GIY-YIG nuclease family protein [Marinifilum sp. D714]|uniref:GIY-YIG nuclease family protein n=1 Tax=Marinifilum sp. D714 TaxID=2937523 RepID=UPI0027C1C549|nr:GIY-YIG nuclease family protein [Marinifilum sp. D714]MDQ2179131.1 GIY-YIG nuclease family protein [Marinifilum sp. D714]